MGRKKLYILVLLLSAAGYLWIFFVMSGNANPLPGCLFRKATGIPCPACGSTGSVVSLLKGDLSGVIRGNPLGILTIIAATVAQVWVIKDLITGTDGFHRVFLRFEKKANGWWLVLIFVVIITIWTWNIIRYC